MAPIALPVGKLASARGPAASTADAGTPNPSSWLSWWRIAEPRFKVAPGNRLLSDRQVFLVASVPSVDLVPKLTATNWPKD